MLNQRIQFTGEGNRLLDGIIRVPDENSKQPIMIICHDFLENMDRDIIADLAIAIANEGIAATLRFNFNIPGNKFGESTETTMTHKIQDLKKAVEYVKKLEYIELDRIFLLGHGLGGDVCLCCEEQNLMGLVTIGTRSDLTTFMKSYFNDFEISEWLKTNVFRYGSITLLSSVYSDIKKYDVLKSAGKSDCPVLVIHGTDDRRNDSGDAVRIRSACKYGTLEIAEGADHYFSDPKDKSYILNVIMNWMLRLLGSLRVV